MDIIDELKAAHPCPLPSPPEGLSIIHDEVLIDTAVLALMDSANADKVWEDFLLDGHDHDHGAGQIMMLGGSLGTHLEFDTTCPVRMYADNDGVYAVEVELVPWEDDVDSGRRPDGWTADDEAEFDWSLYETGAEGWSKPVVLTVESDLSLLADPAEIETPSGNTIEVTWPEEGGTIHASVLSGRGYRRLLRVVWVA